MVKTLIVDDHSLVRQGLESFLTTDDGIEVVGVAINGREALQKARELRPEVILMDVMMPEMDGIEAAALLKQELPDTKIIMLTGRLDIETVNKSVRVRADGYILKDADKEELCNTIRAASTGQFLLSPDVARMLVGESKSTKVLHTLTQREAEVLKLVAKGKANKEIANLMGLSEGTIKTHVSIIIAKLGLQSRTQAALYAAEEGLV